MPNKREHLMMQAVFAFAQGCGVAAIDDDACAWFHDHYSDWMGKKKDHPKVKGTPHEVWNDFGKVFLGRFKLIGERAATKGSPIQASALKDAALSVERDSDCPYCP